MVMPWQSGHDGISDLHIQKRWWLRVMWPDQSWKRSDAWQQSSPDMRQRYFLERVELSIDLSMFSLSQLFHLHLHLFLSLSECDCWRAEVLIGRHLQRSVGRNLALLECAWATNLASSSVHSFVSKSRWPGTQCTWRSTTSFFLPFHCPPVSIICWHTALFMSMSCFAWRHSAAWWITSRIYCPKCMLWLHNALMAAWLSEPKMVGCVNWWLNLQ